MTKYTVIIGRSELINFPSLLLTDIPAKADTGAYRSAIHAKNITLKKKGTKQLLAFDMLADHPTCTYTRHVETTEFSKTKVENSFGVVEERYAVNLKIKLGPKVFSTEFTLADRSVKTYPILLGRKTLNKRFIVDSAKSNIDRQALRKKFNIVLPEDLEVTNP